MEDSSMQTSPQNHLYSTLEKVALGWDFASFEDRMSVRLEKIRRQKQGEGQDPQQPRQVTMNERVFS